MGKQNVKICCSAFSDSLKEGTDNDEYGRALSWWSNDLHIGTVLHPIKFCPWCGTLIKEVV